MFYIKNVCDQPGNGNFSEIKKFSKTYIHETLQ